MTGEQKPFGKPSHSIYIFLMNKTAYNSWGRIFQPTHAAYPVTWQDEVPHLLKKIASSGQKALAFGCGRSYGDSCLNDQHAVLPTASFAKIRSFDPKSGVITCEAGVTFAQLLDIIVPQGWFLPVSPGTKFVSVGGALANDVHGKNHHKSGTFGCHVRRFELIRSNGERLVCSREQNSELFAATIGGLGLTGFITWVEFQLLPSASTMMAVHLRKFSSLDEYLEMRAAFDQKYTYTVAWIDCLATGRSLGRGHLIAGEHHTVPTGVKRYLEFLRPKITFDWPNFVLNPLSMRCFNEVYYQRIPGKEANFLQSQQSFFYPLDGISNWNRIYGKRGMRQFQGTIPFDRPKAVKTILAQVSASKNASFLAVLKSFGDIPSPGMLSYPKPGFTIAIDFPNNGKRTLSLFQSLEKIILDNGGSIYPAKDSCMAKASFEAFYPNLNQFKEYLDPHFSSSFWRRMQEN